MQWGLKPAKRNKTKYCKFNSGTKSDFLIKR